MFGATAERNKVKGGTVPLLYEEPCRERILDNGYINQRISFFFLTLMLGSTLYALNYTSKETIVAATENEAETMFRV